MTTSTLAPVGNGSPPDMRLKDAAQDRLLPVPAAAGKGRAAVSRGARIIFIIAVALFTSPSPQQPERSQKPLPEAQEEFQASQATPETSDPLNASEPRRTATTGQVDSNGQQMTLRTRTAQRLDHE